MAKNSIGEVSIKVWNEEHQEWLRIQGVPFSTFQSRDKIRQKDGRFSYNLAGAKEEASHLIECWERSDQFTGRFMKMEVGHAI